MRVVPRRNTGLRLFIKEAKAFLYPMSVCGRKDDNDAEKRFGNPGGMPCSNRELDTVFGYPGGSVLNIYDALYKYSDRITHVLTAHEQGAAHAADGYARATGVSASASPPPAPALPTW